MRFYLDEALPDDIAVAARRLGVDVTSVHGNGNEGWPDDLQLAYATRAGRCIVTTDYSDFVALAGAYAARGERHAGILPLPRSLLPLRGNLGAIARALHQYAALRPEELPLDATTVDWLHPVLETWTEYMSGASAAVRLAASLCMRLSPYRL